MQKISFERDCFPSEIIVHAVWLYARFTPSFRDVEDLLAVRGLDVSYETVRRWVLKFGSEISANLRTARPAPSDHSHLDEMVIVILGKRHWLWRPIYAGPLPDQTALLAASPISLKLGSSRIWRPLWSTHF